jgi:membrane protease YdiL (CAAX protease family)
MDSKHNIEVSKYGKKDALVVLLLFLFYCVLSVGIVLIDRAVEASLSVQHRQLIGMLLFMTCAIIVFAVILVKKQGFKSIGIHKEKLWPALRLGIMFALIPLVIAGLLPGLMYGWELRSFGLMMYLLLYTFVLAATEDIFFVGFAQTRLYGLFKSDKSAIGAGAALFSLGHVPAWLLMGNLDFENLLFFGIFLVFWFVMHCVHVSIFRRYFSLIPVMMLHTVSNFSQTSIWVLTDENREYADSWAMTAMIAIIIAAGIWGWCTSRKAKKQS